LTDLFFVQVVRSRHLPIPSSRINPTSVMQSFRNITSMSSLIVVIVSFIIVSILTSNVSCRWLEEQPSVLSNSDISGDTIPVDFSSTNSQQPSAVVTGEVKMFPSQEARLLKTLARLSNSNQKRGFFDNWLSSGGGQSGTPLKRQNQNKITYRQCYFNPISCI